MVLPKIHIRPSTTFMAQFIRADPPSSFVLAAASYAIATASCFAFEHFASCSDPSSVIPSAMDTIKITVVAASHQPSAELQLLRPNDPCPF